MGHEITLEIARHVGPGTIAEALGRTGWGPVTVSESSGPVLAEADLLVYAHVNFQGRETGRARTIRLHQSHHGEPVEGSLYTYLAIGAEDEGLELMISLAKRLGGWVTDERMDASVDFDPPAGEAV